MKKNVVLMVVCLMMISPVFADKVILLDFEITKNDEVTMNWLSVVEGKPDESTGGNYALIVSDRESNEISRTTFYVKFSISGTAEELDWRSVMMKVPYRDDSHVVLIEKDSKTIFRQLIGSVCDYDFECDESENYVSCPTDCISGSRDNYCDSVADERCDPDCAISGDEDCEDIIEKTSGLEISPWLIRGGIFMGGIILVAIIFYLVRGKIRKRGPKKLKLHSKRIKGKK